MYPTSVRKPMFDVRVRRRRRPSGVSGGSTAHGWGLPTQGMPSRLADLHNGTSGGYRSGHSATPGQPATRVHTDKGAITEEPATEVAPAKKEGGATVRTCRFMIVGELVWGEIPQTAESASGGWHLQKALPRAGGAGGWGPRGTRHEGNAAVTRAS